MDQGGRQELSRVSARDSLTAPTSHNPLLALHGDDDDKNAQEDLCGDDENEISGDGDQNAQEDLCGDDEKEISGDDDKNAQEDLCGDYEREISGDDEKTDENEISGDDGY